MKKIPLTNWKAEHKKLTAEKDKLYKEFYRQKENIRKVELIQKSVNNALRENSHEILTKAIDVNL